MKICAHSAVWCSFFLFVFLFHVLSCGLDFYFWCVFSAALSLSVVFVVCPGLCYFVCAQYAHIPLLGLLLILPIEKESIYEDELHPFADFLLLFVNRFTYFSWWFCNSSHPHFYEITSQEFNVSNHRTTTALRTMFAIIVTRNNWKLINKVLISR